VTFVHSAPAAGTNGIIAGVLDPQEFISAFRAAAVTGGLSCPGFSEIAELCWQASDILGDGGNVTGVLCDGISIGIGFNAALVANPTQVGVDVPPPPDPCVHDAGTDAPVDGSSDALPE